MPTISITSAAQPQAAAVPRETMSVRTNANGTLNKDVERYNALLKAKEAPTIDSEAPANPVPTIEGVEAVTEAPKLSKEDQDRLDNFEKREKAIRTEAKRLEALKAELEALKAPKPKTEAEIREELKAQFLQDPTQFGISYEDLGQRYLLQPSPEQQKIQALEAKLAEIEGKSEKVLSTFEQQQKAAYDNALKQIEREASRLVATNDAFEAVRMEGQVAIDAISSLVEETYKSEGIVMDVEEAAKEVEAYLVEQYARGASLGKVKARLAPKVAPVADSKPVNSPQTATLSNSLSQASGTVMDRRARAMAAFRGQLK